MTPRLTHAPGWPGHTLCNRTVATSMESAAIPTCPECIRVMRSRIYGAHAGRNARLTTEMRASLNIVFEAIKTRTWRGSSGAIAASAARSCVTAARIAGAIG